MVEYLEEDIMFVLGCVDCKQHDYCYEMDMQCGINDLDAEQLAELKELQKERE